MVAGQWQQQPARCGHGHSIALALNPGTCGSPVPPTLSGPTPWGDYAPPLAGAGRLALLKSRENAAVCHEASVVVNDVQVKEAVVCGDQIERAGAEFVDDLPRVGCADHATRQRNASKIIPNTDIHVPILDRAS